MSAHWAVIPAAGVGKRMGNCLPKQYLALGGRTIIEHTLARFTSHPRIDGVVVALDAQDGFWPSLAVESLKPLITVSGGKGRYESVLNALKRLSATARDNDWVLVHDAVRPCLALDDLDKLMAELEGDAVGGILAAPVRDTLKLGDAQSRVDHTVDRTGLWHALTPQMFRLDVLHDALESAIAAGVAVTDEASAMERVGSHPRLVEGRWDNIKITYPEDLSLAERILAAQAQL
jgi:2-C-methyl-D-erythritol 4-phosphate cytidylyltransferase